MAFPFLEIKTGQIIWAQMQFPKPKIFSKLPKLDRGLHCKKKSRVVLIVAVYHFRAQKQLAPLSFPFHTFERATWYYCVYENTADGGGQRQNVRSSFVKYSQVVQTFLRVRGWTKTYTRIAWWIQMSSVFLLYGVNSAKTRITESKLFKNIRFTYRLNVHYRTHKSSTLVSLLSHMNLAHKSTTYL
jgi:hypothetical protein